MQHVWTMSEISSLPPQSFNQLLTCKLVNKIKPISKRFSSRPTGFVPLQTPKMFQYLVSDDILFWNLLEILFSCFHTGLNDYQFLVCLSVCLLDYFLTDIYLIVTYPILDDLSSWFFGKQWWIVKHSHSYSFPLDGSIENESNDAK